MAEFNLAPGYQKFQTFELLIKCHTIQGPLIAESTVVSDAEDDQDDNVPPPANLRRNMWYKLTGLQIGRTQSEEEEQQPHHSPNTTTFNLDNPTRY